MYKVHVQTKEGKLLDPTTRFGKVRRFIRDKKAEVVCRKPYTIRLLYDIEQPVYKTYIGSTDGGRTNIGNAIINTDDNEVAYTDKIETRNREIPALMSGRKTHRQASRRGERLARKRLAKKHRTYSIKLTEGRKIAGCEKPVPVKDIINTESRFRNRKRHSNTDDVISDGAWLTPTAKQLVQTHLNHVDQLCRLYPISGWCLEMNSFAFMKMEDNTIRGIDFQNGRMKGYSSVEEYVYAIQNGKCAVCGQPLDDVHHIIPRHDNGSDGPDNRIGLCKECHHKLHTGELDIDKAGEKQKYGALSILNQALPYILLGLIERFGEDNVHVCNGYETALIRDMLHLPKDHDMDAVAIASACLGIEPTIGDEEHFELKQFRRQDRANINNQRERTYKIQTDAKPNGEPVYTVVAKNRRPREEQKGPALSQWYRELADKCGCKEAETQRSRLVCIRSTRYYNNRDRIMPGTAFLYKEDRYVLSGQLSKGKYYRAIGYKDKNFPASECRILTRNAGLVYL